MTYSPTEADARDRIEELADTDQTVHAVTRTGGSTARAFYCVVRTWEHPEEDGLSILSVQNAQLTEDWSDMSDTWLSGGYRQRFETGDGAVATALAQSLASAGARIDADADDRPAAYSDVEGDE